MVRPGPVERLRARYAARAGSAAARRLPAGYQRLGRVALVRWPEALRPDFPWLAEAFGAELGVDAVLRVRGAAAGEWRIPDTELLLGDGTETEVREDGLSFRFDAARLLYSPGNRRERERMARLPGPDETVVDLFAGIGYFALPIAHHARPRRTVAVEANPESFAYLIGNIARNGLADRVAPFRGDNREVPLPAGSADRVLLGILPDARPWLGRALPLLRPTGGWLHVHLLQGSADPSGTADAAVRAAVRAAGGEPVASEARRVKAYGPGREHWVVDVRARPKA